MATGAKKLVSLSPGLKTIARYGVDFLKSTIHDGFTNTIKEPIKHSIFASSNHEYKPESAFMYGAMGPSSVRDRIIEDVIKYYIRGRIPLVHLHQLIWRIYKRLVKD